jgi:hypothetical protein
MFRHARNVILIVIAAAVGAVLGRWTAEARARLDKGGDPLAIDLHDLQIRPQDFVPGVVAAFRVGEPPWSWLHIPGWLAAFGTNFAAAAVGGDLDRLRHMAEERAMSAIGLEPEVEIEIEDVPPTPGPSGPVSETPFEPPRPSEPPQAPPPQAPPPPQASAASTTQPVWTSENAGPSANGNGKPPEAETPGFTPLRD